MPKDEIQRVEDIVIVPELLEPSTILLNDHIIKASTIMA